MAPAAASTGHGENASIRPDCDLRHQDVSVVPDEARFASVAQDLVCTKSALANICRYAGSKTDVLNFGSANKVFHEIASSEHVWDRLYEQDFPYFHKTLLVRKGWGGDASTFPYISWFSEYKKRYHRERCWETGNLTRKAPVILSGHLGCVFGACFLGAPFTPGTICTGAHIERSMQAADGANTMGEIKMWLPSRGTTMEQIVREFGDGEGADGRKASQEKIPEGMDVETFTKQEIARAGVLSLYQLPGTAQIACTTFQSGVHILRCREVGGRDDPDTRGKDTKRHKGSGAKGRGFQFEAVMEVMGQEGPCSKTFVDSQCRILALPSYDGAVRLYRLPQWIRECRELEVDEDGDNAEDDGNAEDAGNEGLAGQSDAGTDGNPSNASNPNKPKIYPSSTLYDDMELEVRGEDGSVSMGRRMPMTALTMSNDCKRMFTGSNDTRVKLWDVQREEILHRFEGHEGFIWNVKSLDSELNTAVSTSTDGYARRWDLRQKECTGSINVCAHGPGNVQAVTGVALRGNGYHMAVGSFDSNVYILDMRMMQRLYSVGTHGDKVCRAQLFDKGETDLLMTTGWDRTVRLWEFA